MSAEMTAQLAKIPHQSTKDALTEIFTNLLRVEAESLANKTISSCTITNNLTGNVTGYSTKAKNGTAANAVAASGTLTIDGVVIDGETITIGSRVYEFDTNSSVTPGRTAVNISASAVAGTGTLTWTNVAVDTETITIGSEVYEIDWNGSVTGGRKTVDVSSYVTKASGTLTLSGVVQHAESFVIDAHTWTFKADGTVGGSGVVDITAYATKATAVFSLGGSVADEETVTINARVYEFDTNTAITGDIAVDVSGGATKDLAGAALAAAINGDASADVTAVYSAASNELTVTAKIGGTVGDYTTSEVCANCTWSGNLTGGVSCSAANAITAILANVTETNVTVAAGVGTTAVFTAKAYGSAGTSITFTEAITNATINGAGTLGATVEGTDCSATNAATAMIASITTNSAIVTAATGGAGVVVVTHKVKGAAGNVASTQTCANATWGAGTFGSGADCSKGNAQTAIRSIVNSTETAWQLAAFGGDAAILTAQTKGIALNGVATTKSGVNISWLAVVSAGGVDGTVGAQWDVLIDASYIYICTATNTIADANWKKAAIS